MISLTGASGFLGRHLTQAIQTKTWPVRCLVRENSQHLSELSKIAKEIKPVDYLDQNSIANALRGTDTLIHTLGIINADAATLEAVNEKITQRILEAAKNEGVKKIIHISSVAAGMRHGPYGESKFRGEQYVQKSGIPYTVLRPAYIYGAGDENNTAMLIRTLKRWPIVPLLGGGSFKLQPVYVGDVVNLIIKAIELPAQNTEFNVAGPAQITLKSMLENLAHELRITRVFLPIPLKPVQFLTRFFLKFFPDTKLPAKQILELDKHEAFNIQKTSAIFDFNPLTFNAGVHRMFKEVLCAA